MPESLAFSASLSAISEYIWEIPKNFRSDMRVPARIFANEQMLKDIFKDKSLWQLVNLTTLPGIYKYALTMPDVHEGYGAPIGAVFASNINEGIISPGACGYDINCGVRLLTSQLSYDEIRNRIPKLTETIYNEVPSGVGIGGMIKLNNKEMEQILENGAKWTVEKEYGFKEDLLVTESGGRLEEADADAVSKLAKNRGYDQSGTLGAGNHFIEIQRIQEIYNEEIAKSFGIQKGNISVMIHCGSRGLGHQVATDYIKSFLNNSKINLPDRELACAPFNSSDGQSYFSAMACAANFAWANRQIIAHLVRKSFEKIFGHSTISGLKQVYDIAHNIVKVEEYDGKKFAVHRKGATRAFAGQPVLIPGSMGTSSYVMVGQEKSKELSFSSSSHGAGRIMSRAEAKRTLRAIEIKEKLQEKGITVITKSLSGLAEEAPDAYKDISQVVEIIDNLGIAKKVAKLVPLGVIKG